MLDAHTFSDKEVITLSSEKLISIKINAETDYGIELFQNFKGNAYPLIVFLTAKGEEIDRFYGYLPPYEFLIKIQNALNEKNSFSYFLDRYNKGDHSAELLKKLADKYKDKGEFNKSLKLFEDLLNTSNQSKNDNEYAKYSIAKINLELNNENPMNEFLLDNQFSTYYSKAKEFYSDFLNSNAWNMAESNKNLDLALEQIEKGLSLIDITNKSYPYLLDTKAEILWKLNKSQEAIKVIENAIKIDPNSEYYKAQKIKFQDSLNS